MGYINNSSRQDFGICSIQSALQEVGLYQGSIDGLFGDKCYEGFEKLIGEKIERHNGWDAKNIFLNLQRAMIRKGLDTGGMDGIWGSKSRYVFRQLIRSYQRQNKIASYWFAWSKHENVTQEGIKKIASWLDHHDKPITHTSYLLACIRFETADTFKTDIKNNVSGALGLIQFMPAKLKEWGVNVDNFAQLSFENQLDYVFKFFEEYNYIKKCSFLEDYYLSIFYPSAVGKNPDNIIAKKGTELYSQNSSFDVHNRGYYTASDIAAPVIKSYWEGMSITNRLKITEVED